MIRTKMKLQTKAITEFLTDHTPLAHLYHGGMEVQVNVGRHEGTPLERAFRGRGSQAFTDGTTTWTPYRIPWKAWDNPSYEPRGQTYPLDKYADAIGLTGWDWQARVSRWVGYDIDSDEGHKAGLTESKLSTLTETLRALGVGTLRRSSSGNGFHLYVFFEEPVPTDNHREHAALAKAVLVQLETQLKDRIADQIDCLGGILWVWKRGHADNAFEPIFEHAHLKSVPANWRDYLASGRRQWRPKVPEGIDQRDRGDFEHLCSFFQSILDDDHKKLRAWIIENGERASWWDGARNMLVCHTLDLKRAHKALELEGEFETLSSGSTEHNCFMFPESNGSWSVRRYGRNVSEASCWKTDESGWVRCVFNRSDGLEENIAKFGVLDEVSERIMFESLEKCRAYLATERLSLDDFPALEKSACTIEPSRPRKPYVWQIKVPFPTDGSNPTTPFVGRWVRRTKFWSCDVRLPFSTFRDEQHTAEVSRVAGGLRPIRESDRISEWAYRNDMGAWVTVRLQEVATMLRGQGVKNVDEIITKLLKNEWTYTATPFGDEYPGNHVWNRFGARLAVDPVEGVHPTWDLMLDHVGRGLDQAVAENEWCRTNGIFKGSHYLWCWVAAMFQCPEVPLPYLILWGQQNTGKSIFHESLSTLFLSLRGYMRAEAAIQSESGFNAELAGAVLCVLQETTLENSVKVTQRIKDLVTARHLHIHPKGGTPYMAPNFTHWVHVTNDRGACPIEEGDTRIVITQVHPFEGEEIPRSTFMARIEEEAPAFLHTILHLFELPPQDGRLRVPIVTTADKIEEMAKNSDPVNAFLDTYAASPGSKIKLSEAFDHFRSGLSNVQKARWNVARFREEVVKRYPVGDINNIEFIGNLTAKGTEQAGGTPLVRNAMGRLVEAAG